MNKFRIVGRLIKGENSLGDSSNLLDYIRERYTEQDYNSGCEVIIAVTNLDTRRTEYKFKSQYSYEEFTFWAWISTLAYPFTEYVMVDGVAYGDGGYTTPLPIEIVAQLATTVDIVLSYPKTNTTPFRPCNIIKGVRSVISVLLSDSLQDNLESGERLRQEKGLDFNYYFPKHLLSENAMYFNKKEMSEWYNEGLNTVPIKSL
jgi:predicted patatin/cPLA2 family phospholipase